MHRARQFLRQRRVDRPLALHPRQPLEGGGLDHHIEMALAAAPRACVSGMARGVVVDSQARGGKGVGELAFELLNYDAHYFAFQFVACQFLIGKSSDAYFSQ